MLTLLLATLGMVGARLRLSSLFFSRHIPVDIQLVNFLLLSNVSELKTGEKKIDKHYHQYDTLYLPKYHNLLLIFVKLFLIDWLIPFQPLNVFFYLK